MSPLGQNKDYRSKGAAYFESILNANAAGTAMPAVPLPQAASPSGVPSATSAASAAAAAAAAAASGGAQTHAHGRSGTQGKKPAIPLGPEFELAETILGKGGPVLALGIHFATLATGIIFARISMHVLPVPGLFLLLQAATLGALTVGAYKNGMLCGAGAAAAAAAAGVWRGPAVSEDGQQAPPTKTAAASSRNAPVRGMFADLFGAAAATTEPRLHLVPYAILLGGMDFFLLSALTEAEGTTVLCWTALVPTLISVFCRHMRAAAGTAPNASPATPPAPLPPPQAALGASAACVLGFGVQVAAEERAGFVPWLCLALWAVLHVLTSFIGWAALPPGAADVADAHVSARAEELCGVVRVACGGASLPTETRSRVSAAIAYASEMGAAVRALPTAGLLVLRAAVTAVMGVVMSVLLREGRHLNGHELSVPSVSVMMCGVVALATLPVVEAIRAEIAASEGVAHTRTHIARQIVLVGAAGICVVLLDDRVRLAGAPLHGTLGGLAVVGGRGAWAWLPATSQ